MEGQSALVTSVLYTYLSLLCWHTTPGLADLKELETQLCVSLLRSKVRWVKESLHLCVRVCVSQCCYDYLSLRLPITQENL